MHLDTVLNLVATKKALTLPYLFLKKYDGDNPVVNYLKAVEDRPKKELEKGEVDLERLADFVVSEILRRPR